MSDTENDTQQDHDRMPRRPAGDIDQGVRGETVEVEDDPASLADAVEAAKRARGL